MSYQLRSHKLLHHPKEIKDYQEGKMFPPIFIEFGPVGGCNHRCVHCYVQKILNTPPEMMDTDVYIRFMEEIGDYGVKAIVLAGVGEPLLHKATPRAIEGAVKHGTDVGLFTNGIPLNEKNIPSLLDNLTYIRFTINGSNKNNYAKTHQTSEKDWDKLLKNLDMLANYKQKRNSKCTLGVYTVLFEDNLPDLLKWIKHVKSLDFDYIIAKPPNVRMDNVKMFEQLKFEKNEKILNEIRSLNDKKFHVELREDLFNDAQTKKRYSECLGLPFMCAVDSDGSVYTCNWYWREKKYLYGNLKNSTFKEIWESEQKKKVLEFVADKNSGFDIKKCGACRQDNINLFLENLKYGRTKIEIPKGEKPEHINFL